MNAGSLIDTPDGNLRHPSSAGETTSSAISGLSDRQTISSSRRSSPRLSYANAIQNPFISALPSKPDRIIKTRDLPGIVAITKNTKAGDARKKCHEANARIVHSETLIKSLYHRASETHSIAKKQLDAGAKLLNKTRQQLTSMSKERDELLKKKEKIQSEKEKLKHEKDSTKELTKLKDRESRRSATELSQAKKEIATLKKKLKEAQDKLTKQSEENNGNKSNSFHTKKVIEVEAYAAKKRVDEEAKERREHKKVEGKKARLEGISSGSGFEHIFEDYVSFFC